jgi:sec-independent protein translocase protein TatC
MALLPFSQSKVSRRFASYDGLFPADVSVLDLLDGFRRLLLRSAIAVAVGIVLGFSFTPRVVDFVLEPTVRALAAGSTLIYTQPGEAFTLYIQIALIMGVALAMPYIMYQLWRMLGPLVPASARRFAIPFALFTSFDFVLGAAFTHFIAFPYMMVFFASFDTPDLTFLPQLNEVFDLYMKMVLGMGVIFQMPTVVFFLAKAGLVTARFLWRSFRFAFLIIFVAAAVITPTGDMVTQTIFAAPMIGLYLLSILVARMFGKTAPETNDTDLD